MKPMRLITVLIAIAIALTPISVSAAYDSLQIYLARGGAAFMVDSLEKAEEAFDHALRLDSANFDALKNLGVINSALGDKEAARKFLLRAYKIDSTNANVCHNLGVAYSEFSDPEAAVKYLKKAVFIDTANVMFKLSLSQVLSKAGKITEALPLLRSVLASQPVNGEALYSMGNCFASMKQYDSAAAYYESSLKVGGGGAKLHYHLGTVQQRMGHGDEAVKSFQRALKASPKFKDCLQSLAMLYLYKQQYPDASETFHRVLEVDSLHFPAIIGLGSSLALSGISKQADSIMYRLFATDSTLGYQMRRIVRTERLRQKNSTDRE